MSTNVKSPYEIVIRPIVTEKTVDGGFQNKFTFQVALSANKWEIADAIEAIQTETKNPVNVISVNTIVVKGKNRRGRFMKRSNKGRSSDWKKAIVTLRPGQTIELVEGV